MYYCAGILYFLTEPPDSGFDLGQALATIFFVNSWHPLLIPTVSDRWMVVPGGWSIGVEFTFYLLFPLMAAYIRSMRSALIFCVVAVAFGTVANISMTAATASQYGETAVTNFIYFWFPNQLPVFALGTVLYFIIVKLRADAAGPVASLFSRYGTAIALLSLLGCAIVANTPFPNALPPQPPLLIPTLYVASLLFMLFAAALSCAPGSMLVNSAICALGRVSFSAYLLHFAVLHKLTHYLPGIFDVEATDWKAILTCFALLLAALPITYALSYFTFNWIENPLIGTGRYIIENRRSRRG
jgi:peptidoglycan/LPS O-acetylase OafA/YrhL